MSQHKEKIRSKIRFPSDPNTIAWLSKGKNKYVALVMNESFSGCCLVINQETKLEAGDKCEINIGEIGPLKAEIRWLNAIDKNLFKFGIMYLE